MGAVCDAWWEAGAESVPPIRFSSIFGYSLPLRLSPLPSTRWPETSILCIRFNTCCCTWLHRFYWRSEFRSHHSLRELPDPLRRRLLKPLVRNRALRRVCRVFVHPLGASLLFIFALYFRQIPHFMDLIALHDSLDEFAHVTMLISGLFSGGCCLIRGRHRMPCRIPRGLRPLHSQCLFVSWATRTSH